MVGFEPSDTPIVTGGSKTGSKSIAPQGILRDGKIGAFDPNQDRDDED
jgi:hypothetical protein